MAVEFVKFLLSRDEMVSMYTKNTAIPIRTDITAADIGRTDDPYFAQAVEMAGGLYFWPDNCLSADVVNIYCSLPCQVLVGNMSLDELTRQWTTHSLTDGKCEALCRAAQIHGHPQRSALRVIESRGEP